MAATLDLTVMNEQKATWTNEYLHLEEGGKVDPATDIASLTPFMEDGIIKMRKWLEYSKLLPEQTRFPVILPNHSKLSELLILRAHRLSDHARPEQTKRDVRTEYWIIGGKRRVTSVSLCLCIGCGSRIA